MGMAFAPSTAPALREPPSRCASSKGVAMRGPTPAHRALLSLRNAISPQARFRRLCTSLTSSCPLGMAPPQPLHLPHHPRGAACRAGSHSFWPYGKSILYCFLGASKTNIKKLSVQLPALAFCFFCPVCTNAEVAGTLQRVL